MKVIPSARKAQLMDYFLLGWQTSTYKLSGSDKKWFMKPYEEIVNDTDIPKSTLGRFIKELCDEGFIERRQALYSRTSSCGSFEVKKGTYINVTDQLLNILSPSKTSNAAKETLEQEKDIHTKDNNSKQESQLSITRTKPECVNLEKNEMIDSLKMRGLYIRDLYRSSINNNIISKKIIKNVDKAELPLLTKQFESIQELLFAEIKEEIPDAVKKLVLGTFFHLSFTHQKKFSSPKQIVAEYLFSLVNIDFYMPHIVCFKHRNNILSKLLRSNNWRTPKGFYKHFYLGQNFKDQQEIREKRWQETKEKEFANPVFFETVAKDSRLIELEAQMCEKMTLIEKLTESLYQQSEEEDSERIKDEVKKLKQELSFLWDEQYLIEKEEIEREQLCD